MKKIIFVLVLVAFMGIISVKATTESELKTKLMNGFEIGGEVIKPTDYQAQEIERYLNKYEVSDEHATFISEKIDEIYNIAKSCNAKSFTDLTSDAKSKIVSIVAEISSNTSVKASLTKNGILTIYESDGKTVFAEIIDKDITKQTGSNNILFVTFSIVSVFGIAYVAKKVSKVNG